MSEVIGHGVDIIEIDRVKEAIAKYGKDFEKRVCTERELKGISGPSEVVRMAGRFAAKEAIIKAFGNAKEKPLVLNEIEILNKKDGSPNVFLKGEALKLKGKLKVKDILISISHSRDYAVASAILTR